jgi:hypothetical protein
MFSKHIWEIPFIIELLKQLFSLVFNYLKH